MIALNKVSKAYPTRGGSHVVLKDVDMVIHPGEKIGILGRNGAGKSTLVRVLSGAERPCSGHISRTMSISWPLAFSGAFQGSLSGLDNLKFICRVYGVDPAEKVGYVQDFAELGRYFREPVKTYSSGMRARLAFAISMAIEFDCFLVDEVIAVGDARFQDKCHYELHEQRRDRALVMVTHDMNKIHELQCQCLVLDGGSLTRFSDPDLATAHYLSICQ